MLLAIETETNSQRQCVFRIVRPEKAVSGPGPGALNTACSRASADCSTSAAVVGLTPSVLTCSDVDFVELMPFKQRYEKLKRVSADTLQKVALKQENKLASHRKVYTVRCMPLTLASRISVYVHTGVHRGIPQGQDPRKGR